MYALGGSVCGEVAPRQSARAAYSSSVFGLGQIGPGLDWQSGPWSDTPESELIWTVCLSRGRSHAPSPPGRSWRKFRLGVARRRVARFCEAASLAPDDARVCERAAASTRGLRVPVSWGCTPRLAVPPIWRTWLLPKAWCPC